MYARVDCVLHTDLDLAMADRICRSEEVLQEQKEELCALLLDDMKQAFYVPNLERRAGLYIETLWPQLSEKNPQERDRYSSWTTVTEHG